MSKPAGLHLTSATELAALVRGRQVTVTEVAEASLSRLDDLNPRLNAIIYVNHEQVMADAKAQDAAIARGEALGPLHGVPYTIKDNTSVAGLRCTSGFRPLKDNVATEDAPVASRLREAGGLFLGKTNLPELGYYGGCENHLFGATDNPFRSGYTSGGSSGGAAASVAAGMTPLAEGNDGAGSVRIPASLCGTVGMKPTVGLVPDNVPGHYHSFAFHGPITRTVADAALLLDVMAGLSERDPKSIAKPVDSFVAASQGAVRGLRVAWSDDLGLGVHVDPEVVAVCRELVTALPEAGIEVSEAAPSWGVDTSTAMWEGLWIPVYAEDLDLFDWGGLRGEVDDNLIEIVRQAEDITAAQVGRAWLARGRMWEIFSSFMDDYDVIACPTVASAAFPLGTFCPPWLQGAPLRQQILDWLLTYPFNMLTNPAITIPAGSTANGRPVGIQFAARHREDALLLRLARTVEQIRPWAKSYDRI